jgi:transposase-like protein
MSNEKFNRKKEAAISALLSCDTVQEAADQVGIGRRTLFRWLQDGEFKRQYQEAKQAVLFETIKNLTTASTATVDVLHHTLINSKSDHAKIQAARMILDFSFKGMEYESILSQIDELREVVESYENNKYR